MHDHSTVSLAKFTNDKLAAIAPAELDYLAEKLVMKLLMLFFRKLKP